MGPVRKSPETFQNATITCRFRIVLEGNYMVIVTLLFSKCFLSTLKRRTTNFSCLKYVLEKLCFHVGDKPPPNVSRFLGYFALFRITSKVLTLSTPNLENNKKNKFQIIFFM